MIKAQVYKLTRNMIILLLILFVLDRGIGIGLERLFYKQKHGDDYVSIYLLEHTHDDILIMGSSRASHHYNSTIIEHDTHMSCFNGGRDDMSILYSAATLPIVYSKENPKIIFLEILPTELWLTPKTNESYEVVSGVLLPFCHKYPSLLNTISLAGKEELFKVKASYIYPYNSTIGSSIQNSFSKLGHVSIKGYEPLNGSIDTANYKKPVWGDFTAGQHTLDTNAVMALTQVIQLAKKHNTRLITVFSPFYFPIDFYETSSYKAIKKILQDNNCELYDFTHDVRFLKNPYLFYDDVHLNDSGATIFDSTIVDIINKGAEHH